MKVILDTSAFILENKPDDEKEAIIELTKCLPDLDITIYVSRKIIKEYGSKLRLFPGRFREFFKNVISKARTQRPCKILTFGNLKIHRVEPAVNLNDRFRSTIRDRCKRYDLEDEKFLELFIHLGRSEKVLLVTVSDDLICMAREAGRLLRLKGSVKSGVYAFLVELKTYLI